jgi:hypothetical protein
MLLSGAFLGLVISDNASADPYDVNGTVTGLNSDVSVTILNIETGYSEDTTTAEDGYYSFNCLCYVIWDTLHAFGAI